MLGCVHLALTGELRVGVAIVLRRVVPYCVASRRLMVSSRWNDRCVLENGTMTFVYRLVYSMQADLVSCSQLV